MKKFLKTIAVISAMLVAVSAFTACGKKEEKKAESSTAASSAASSDKTEADTTVAASTQAPETEADTTVAETTAPAANNHQIINSKNIVLAEDDVINTDDATAEALLNAAIKQQGIDEQMAATNEQMNGEATLDFYVKGNTMVAEINAVKDLTDEEKENIGPAFEGSAEEMVTAFQTLKDEYNITVAMVVAVVENNGNVCYSKVFSA